jgi:hypothetical protein
MLRKRTKKTLILIIFSSIFSSEVDARGGSNFGWFAGGAVAGGLLGSAIAKSNSRRYDQPVIVERPVYVQQPVQPVIVQQPAPQTMQPSANTQETTDLKNLLNEQDERIQRLERELREERRAAKKRTELSKQQSLPKKQHQLKEDIFDGFEPENQ